MKNKIEFLIFRLKGVNDIIDTYSGGKMPFEQAFMLARFYYDYQDTNVVIDEAETMATQDSGRLRELAVSLKDETAILLNYIGRLESIDFKEIANVHAKQYYSRFQEASEKLNPYWKRYCELNNRLDYLPLGSKEYIETEKGCEEAKAEHDKRQIEVKRLYTEYEEERNRSGSAITLAAPSGRDCGYSQARTRQTLPPVYKYPYMPRKKLPSGELRTATITTKITAAERIHIQETARRCGLTPSEYIRQRAIGSTDDWKQL